jgi:hypothetical protein
MLIIVKEMAKRRRAKVILKITDFLKNRNGLII